MSDTTDATTTPQGTPALSDRMTQVVRMHDEGMSNTDIAASLGIKAGTVSNALTEGLRRLGRGDEVNTPGTSTGSKGKGRRRTLRDMIEANIAQVKARVEGLSKDLAEAEAEAQAIGTEEDLKAREATLAEAAKVAADALKAFRKDPTPIIDEAKAKAQAKVDEARKAHDAEAQAIAPEVEAATAFLASMPQAVADAPAPDAPAEDDAPAEGGDAS